MQGQRVLIVEDQDQVVSFITPYLKDIGLVVHHAPTISQAREVMNGEHHGVIILDWMLPDGDGAQFCKDLRLRGNMTPVIMLTARDEDDDKITGLDSGADDYMTKPFNPEELVARVRALLRRAQRKSMAAKQLKVKDIVLDGEKRIVTKDGVELQFAPKEFDLLWELMEADGRVLSRKELLERVWLYTYIGDTRTVDVHVRGIRRKLNDEELITTSWGKGYRVNEPVTRVE
jgi:DNA-binding response OmpR family regulator